MSWSVCAHGTREEVHAAIDAAVDPELAFGDQVLEFERANCALHSLVASLREAASYSLSAHGSYDACSIDVRAAYAPVGPAPDA